MSILSFIQRLTPSFKRNSIVESCSLTSTAIREKTLPSVAAAEVFFKAHPFKSKEAKDMASVYDKKVGRSGSLGAVGSVREGLENSDALLAWVADEAKKVYADTEANIGLTYTKATLMRLIGACEFASSYALKWINQLYILETGVVDKEVTLRNSLSPAEVQWLEDHFFDFCTAITILRRPLKEIEKSVADLPDASITELTEKTFPGTLGESRIDPFNMRNLSVAWNPFYILGLITAERQANAYKATKAEYELLQMRLLNLQKIHEKTPDARLQKEIDHMASRVSGLNYEVERLEKEYLNG